MNRISELFRGRAAYTSLPHLHDNTPNFKSPTVGISPRDVRLDIYVGRRCPICQAAGTIIEQMRRDMPNVRINVIDLDAPNTPRPDAVVALPSFMINGHLVATGNPELEELKRFIQSLN